MADETIHIHVCADHDDQIYQRGIKQKLDVTDGRQASYEDVTHNKANAEESSRERQENTVATELDNCNRFTAGSANEYSYTLTKDNVAREANREYRVVMFTVD